MPIGPLVKPGSKGSSSVYKPSAGASAGGAAGGAVREMMKEKEKYEKAKSTSASAAKTYNHTPTRVSSPDYTKSGIKGGLKGAAAAEGLRMLKGEVDRYVNAYKEGGWSGVGKSLLQRTVFY
jgi:hypothetical protein